MSQTLTVESIEAVRSQRESAEKHKSLIWQMSEVEMIVVMSSYSRYKSSSDNKVLPGVGVR